MKKYALAFAKLALVFGLTAFAESSDDILIDEVETEEDIPETTTIFIPNDPLFPQQWGLKNDSGFDIDAPEAWALTRGSKKIAIAVIDTGIDYTHPDLANNLWVNPNEIPGNGIDDDRNGYVDDIHGINALTGTGDPMDDNGHGTHVAGIIGAEANNGIGIAGVMNEVSLIACKFLDANGAGATQAAVRCLKYIADLASRDDDITIIATNNAWGGGAFSQDIYDALEEHRELGILFVTDAGGEAQNNDNQEHYPAAYDLSNVIVVAKADQNGALTSFTNFGPNSVHVAAPGIGLWSTGLNGGYDVRSGSSTTGFVSGLAGLLRAHNPSLSWAQIKHKIMSGTVAMASEEDSEKIISGGFVNAFQSLTHN